LSKGDDDDNNNQKYTRILEKFLTATAMETVVDPEDPGDVNACPNEIFNLFTEDVVFHGDGIGTFTGPTIASEYTCVLGIQILVPGNQVYSLDEIVYAVVQKNIVYFNAPVTSVVKIPTNGWDEEIHFWPSGQPEQYEVSLGSERLQMSITGRVIFTKDDDYDDDDDDSPRISQINFVIGDIIGVFI